MNIFHCHLAIWTLVKLGLLCFLVTLELIVFGSLEQPLFKVQVKAKAPIPSQEPYINGGLVHDRHTFMRQIVNHFCVKSFGQRKLLSTY